MQCNQSKKYLQAKIHYCKKVKELQLIAHVIIAKCANSWFLFTHKEQELLFKVIIHHKVRTFC